MACYTANFTFYLVYKIWARKPDEKFKQLDANNFTMIFSRKWPLRVSDIYMSIFRSSYI